jgi:hypothetical protein
VNDDEIRRKIRAKFVSGDLPTQHPTRTWGGPGTGQPCAVCDELIDEGSAEIEAASADGKHRFYHARCYSLLAAERDKRTSGD